MSTYAIGDLQGCLQAFKQLLKRIDFNPKKDMLWLTGDLINRGPESLETLRFVYTIRHALVTVLGNHDLHLLAVAEGVRNPSASDTLNDILAAPDRDELLEWLRHQPLLHHDASLAYTMVHAGIPPQWSLKKAIQRAAEVEAVLRSEQFSEFLHNMYGNTPTVWTKDLKKHERWRVITNYFTRMRFCTPKGQIELTTKSGIHHAPKGYAPWFEHIDRKTYHDHIIFGHWASLEGEAYSENVFALDTGCVWGNALTAMRLDDQKRFSVNCDCQAYSTML
jgi:bis(5'-nucleosyl)-tetraphosphatase (symmetrical)